MSSGRFDYVKYDKEAEAKQVKFKLWMNDLEKLIQDTLPEGRAKSIALTKLEEVYMWIGKGVRDDQVTRNKGAELQEARSNI